jgi:hypothetical protein|tara:strand:+ start:404 stop:1024 length:621 start_codon:yes stop_codon:yes gene_type:complete
MAGSDVKARFISDEVAADPDGISASAQVANNAALVIGGALADSGAVTLAGSGRKLVVVSGGDDSGISFTIVGTDVNGSALTESLTGADSGTATSSNYFKTITSITAVGDPAGTVTAGTSASAADVVFAGRTRLKGYSIVSGGTAGVIEFFNGDPNASGSATFKARTIGTDNTTIDNTIPEEGVVFEDGLYVVYTIATVDMMTFFHG